jgi:hypothetical protein
MHLSSDTGEKVLLLGIGAVFGAVLAVLGNLFVVQWNKADVRYDTAGAYFHPTLGIATVWLKNWGGTTAENVTFTVSFPDPFTNVSTDTPAITFEPSAASSDKKSVTGTIKKLVPKRQVNIYFITEPSSPRGDKKAVIEDIQFDGGLGRPGTPILWTWGLPILVACVFWGGVSVIVYVLRQADLRSRESYGNHLCRAIQMGHTAAQAGTSEVQLQAEVEADYQAIR